MRLHPLSPFRKVIAFLCLGAVLCLLPGCLTAPPAPQLNFSEPGWSWRRGQAVWTFKKDSAEMAGDLEIATHTDGRTFLQFTKSPLPIVSAWIFPDRWRLQFGPQGRAIGGKGLPAPRWGWAHLPSVASGVTPPDGWKWEKQTGGRWRFSNAGTGEVMEGWLDP